MLKTIEFQRQGGDVLRTSWRRAAALAGTFSVNWNQTGFRVCPRLHKQPIVKELSCATMMFFNHACCPRAFIQSH